MPTVQEIGKGLGWLTPIGAVTNIATGSQPEDMAKLNEYMVKTPAKTTNGQSLKTAWNAWFNDLSWFERNIDKSSWMTARNKVSEFNLANATSADERKMIELIQKQAGEVELEQLAKMGKSAPINIETGKFEPPDKLKHSGPRLKWMLLGGTTTVVAALGAYLVPVTKVRVPLGLTALVSFLGTSTYIAFTIED